jgi:hypothetical protein
VARAVEAILHRFHFDTTTPIDSGGYGFIKNADSLQAFAMVQNADQRHDASSRDKTHRSQEEL